MAANAASPSVPIARAPSARCRRAPAVAKCARRRRRARVLRSRPPRATPRCAAADRRVRHPARSSTTTNLSTHASRRIHQRAGRAGRPGREGAAERERAGRPFDDGRANRRIAVREFPGAAVPLPGFGRRAVGERGDQNIGVIGVRRHLERAEPDALARRDRRMEGRPRRAVPDPCFARPRRLTPGFVRVAAEQHNGLGLAVVRRGRVREIRTVCVQLPRPAPRSGIEHPRLGRIPGHEQHRLPTLLVVGHRAGSGRLRTVVRRDPVALDRGERPDRSVGHGLGRRGSGDRGAGRRADRRRDQRARRNQRAYTTLHQCQNTLNPPIWFGRPSEV